MDTSVRGEQPPETLPTIDPQKAVTLLERHRLRRIAHLRRKVSWGIHINFLNADLVECCGMLGFHWLFLDGERTTITPGACRDLVRAADLAGMFVMARVTTINATEIEGYLDAGVMGILAPSISNADEAEALVKAVKYPMRGRRRTSTHARSAEFGVNDRSGRVSMSSSSHARHFLEANCATFTAALIENQAGFENIDEILAVPGLDFLALGPNDLALSLGSDNIEHPRVKSLLEAARRRLKAANRPTIAVVPDAVSASTAAAGGATLVAIPDVALMNSAGNMFFDHLEP